jgi:glycogen synthase
MKEDFSWTQSAKKYASLYEKLYAEKVGASASAVTAYS